MIVKTRGNHQVAFFHFESTTSTMDEARGIATRIEQGEIVLTDGPISAFAISATEQTKGRGRAGRSWISSGKEAVYLSMLFVSARKPVELSGLSLVVGMSLVRLFRNLGARNVGVKWPNDVLVEEASTLKKVAGILIESWEAGNVPSSIVCHSDRVGEGQPKYWMNIGVGINVANEDVPEGIPATSLSRMLAAEISREDALSQVTTILCSDIAHFFRDGFSSWHNQWRSYSLLEGRSVRAMTGEGEVAGVARGIDEHGHLLLSVGEGESPIVIHSGDVNVTGY